MQDLCSKKWKYENIYNMLSVWTIKTVFNCHRHYIVVLSVAGKNTCIVKKMRTYVMLLLHMYMKLLLLLM